MRIPTRPPDRHAIFDRSLSNADFRRFMARSKIADEKSRYLHWDELRYKPKPAGLTHEEWWTAIRVARQIAGQTLPLTDKAGEDFWFCEPPSLKAAERFLDMNAGGALAADSIGVSSQEGRVHLTRSLAEEPFASSFIEGAATTRQIAKKLIFEGRRPRTRDEQMVLNNFRAMEFVRQFKDAPLDLKLLLELHALVTTDTMDNPADAGRVRTSDDIQVVDDSTGEILHQPPLAAELPERLQLLFDFANQEEHGDAWVHPLLKAIILHFMLAYEHPFVDGNGRVARALFYWYALKAGYWLLEYVSISSVIAEAKISYGRAFLFAESDEADLTYFLINQVQTLTKALKRLHDYVERKKAEVQAIEGRLNDRSRPDAFNHRQVWILNEFVRGRQPRVTIVDHQTRHGVSYLTARSDLEKLTDVGLLRKTKLAQTSIYRPVTNLAEKLAQASREPD